MCGMEQQVCDITKNNMIYNIKQGGYVFHLVNVV